jgi:hypothetical protein
MDEYTEWLYNATATYTVPLTLLYRIFGPVQLVGMVFTGVLGAGAAVLVTRLSLESLSRRASLGVGLVVALLPSQVLFSALTLKDAAVWLLLAASAVLVAVSGRQSGRRLLVTLVGVGAVLLLLGHVRLHTMVIAAWAVALASLAGKTRGWWTRTMVAWVLLLATPVAVGAGPAGYGLVAQAKGHLEYRRVANAFGAATAIAPPAADARPAVRAAEAATIEAEELARHQSQVTESVAATARRLQELQTKAQALQAGATTAGERAEAARLAALAEDERVRLARLQAQAERLTVEVAGQVVEAGRAREQALAAVSTPHVADTGESSALRDLKHLPTGLLVMLLAPLPWEVSDNRSVRFAAMENVVWYPLVLLAAVGSTVVWRQRRILLFPLLAAGATVLTYALSEGNFGTAYRHRGEFVWAVALLAGHGAMVLVQRRRRSSTATH